ncbi:MAG: LysR family transcriptional regulator [Alphaproteobacteria bacterium]|nr:LysR family transcriptional regulator [Alphaproteobacteria bacterium]
MTLSLPPLNALRAFECAARRASYVTAAAELGVSPAAVSQQVRKLEDFLGKTLFTRHNNRVALTDAGAAIYENIHRAFEDIAQATTLASAARPRSRLVIAALPSVSERWLAPRLVRFAGLNAGFRFDLRSEAAGDASGGSDVDLWLDYGASGLAGFEVQLLVRDEVVPLCAPSYLAGLAAPPGEELAAVPDEDFIHTEWGRDFGSRPSWRDWCARYAKGRVLSASGNQASHSGLALELAARGLGVVLGQKMLAADEISAGRLVALSPHALALGHGYYLKYPKAKAHKPLLRELVAFLAAPVQQA